MLRVYVAVHALLTIGQEQPIMHNFVAGLTSMPNFIGLVQISQFVTTDKAYAFELGPKRI